MPRRVVTLGDSSLSTDDLALLVPPAWLNDQLVSFWFEHLRIHALAGDSRVAVLLPNLVHFVALTADADALRQIAAAHRLADRSLILLPVNNSREQHMSAASGPSGSHWSLLVYETSTHTAYHLDSMSAKSNSRPSKLLAEKLRALLGSPQSRFVELDVPTQTNTYDCGAYLCIFAEHVVQNFLQHKPIADLYQPPHNLTAEYVDIKRQQIGTLACRLLDQQHPDDNKVNPQTP